MGFSLRDEAHRHVDRPGQPGAVSGDLEYNVPVMHVRDIVDHLAGVQRTGNPISFMDFHVHGGPGSVAIGNETIHNWRRQLGSRGLEAAFAADARIEFHGCNVARGGDGEAFLADCAWTLLRQNGGTVWGSRGYVFAYPGGATPASPGGEVVAAIAAGGHVQLRGARRLIPTRLRARRLRLWRSYERIRRRVRLPVGERRMATILRLLRDSEELLRGAPSYRAMGNANRQIASAARYLRGIDPTLRGVPLPF